MNLKAKPLLLLVATLCLLLVAIITFWLALLPSLALKHMQEAAKDQGFNLEADRPHLSFGQGVSLVIPDVTLSAANTGPSPATTVTAPVATLALGPPQLLGLSRDLAHINLEAPVIEADLTNLGGMPSWSDIKFSDATLRLRDKNHKATLSMRDVNGTLQRANDGSAKLLASGLLNDVLVDLSLDLEDATRLGTTGTPADLTLSSRSLQLGFSGRMRAADALQLDGQASLDADDGGDVMQLLGAPLKSLSDGQALHLQAGISTTGSEAHLTLQDALLGGAHLTGRIDISGGEDRPQVSADVKADRLVVLAPSSDAKAWMKGWSETTLPFSDLLSLDAKLTIAADKMIINALQTGPGTVSLTLQNGALQSQLEAADVGGAAARMVLGLTHGSSENGLSLKVEAKQIAAEKVLAGALSFEAMSGPFDLSIDVTAKGSNVASLISQSAGSVALASTEAKVLGVDAAGLHDTTKMPWPAASGLPLNAVFDMRAKLSEGIATLVDSKFKLGGDAFKPEGEVDLLRQAMQIKLKQGFQLSGPWGAPRVLIGN